MLTCKDTVRQASDYIDNCLPWQTRLLLRLHLLACVFCRRFLKQFALASDTASTPAKKPATQEEIARVMEQIDRHS